MSSIHFGYFGRGEKTLLLLPGWTHPLQNEPKFIEKLSKEFKIVSVDLPGYVSNPDLTTYHDFIF